MIAFTYRWSFSNPLLEQSFSIRTQFEGQWSNSAFELCFQCLQLRLHRLGGIIKFMKHSIHDWSHAVGQFGGVALNELIEHRIELFVRKRRTIGFSWILARRCVIYHNRDSFDGIPSAKVILRMHLTMMTRFWHRIVQMALHHAGNQWCIGRCQIERAIDLGVRIHLLYFETALKNVCIDFKWSTKITHSILTIRAFSNAFCWVPKCMLGRSADIEIWRTASTNCK